MPTQGSCVIARSRLFDIYQILRTFYPELTESYYGHLAEMQHALLACQPPLTPDELTSTTFQYLETMARVLNENPQHQFVAARKSNDCPDELRFSLLSDEQLQDLTRYSAYSMQNFRAGKAIIYLIKHISPHVSPTSALTRLSVFHPDKKLVYIDIAIVKELHEILAACRQINALKINAHEHQEIHLSVTNAIRIKHRQARIDLLMDYLERIGVSTQKDENELCLIG